MTSIVLIAVCCKCVIMCYDSFVVFSSFSFFFCFVFQFLLAYRSLLNFRTFASLLLVRRCRLDDPSASLAAMVFRISSWDTIDSNVLYYNFFEIWYIVQK